MDRENSSSLEAMHAAMGSPASPIIPDVRCGSLLMPLRQDPVGVGAARHHVFCAGCRMTYLITMGEFG
jgi:hypothetical protein